MTIVIIALCAMALMTLEAFIPGISIAGIAGAVLIVAAAYLCWQTYGAFTAILLSAFCVASSVLIMKLAYRSMKSGRLSKSGLFMNEVTSAAVQSVKTSGALEVGMLGTAQTPLRPAGIAEFHGERVHVSANSGFIELNTKVRIVSIAGSRICVENAAEHE